MVTMKEMIEKMQRENPQDGRHNATMYLAELVNSDERLLPVLGFEKLELTGKVPMYAFRTKALPCYVAKVEDKYVPCNELFARG